MYCHLKYWNFKILYVIFQFSCSVMSDSPCCHPLLLPSWIFPSILFTVVGHFYTTFLNMWRIYVLFWYPYLPILSPQSFVSVSIAWLISWLWIIVIIFCFLACFKVIDQIQGTGTSGLCVRALVMWDTVLVLSYSGQCQWWSALKTSFLACDVIKPQYKEIACELNLIACLVKPHYSGL